MSRWGNDDDKQASTGQIAEHCAKGWDSGGRRLPANEDWVYMHLNDSSGKYPGPFGDPQHGGALESGKNSRRLLKLSTLHRQVLATYDGDIGKRWDGIFLGARRLGCLYHLTEAGDRLVHELGGAALPDRLIEQAFRDQDCGVVDPERDRLLRLAHSQGHALLHGAREAFRNTK